MTPILGQPLEAWQAEYPLLRDLLAYRETLWLGAKGPAAPDPADLANVQDAAARLQRFAPLLAQAFPETAHASGLFSKYGGKTVAQGRPRAADFGVY